MSLLVIPALDLSAGRLARFTPNGPAPLDAFGGDPAAAADALVAAGATWLHVVDMDLAFKGRAENLLVLERLVGAGARIQAAGAVAARAEVALLLEAGASRVVLGSAALHDRRGTAAILAEFGERVAVAIEVAGGRIRPRGRLTTELDLEEALGWLLDAGPARFVHTSVPLVGGLAGPDVEGLARFVERVAPRPVVASGGVGSVRDLDRLAPTGVEAAIVGRGLLEGELPTEVLRAGDD